MPWSATHDGGPGYRVAMTVVLVGVLLGLVSTVIVMTVLYYLIRFAVRDGVVDANRRADADRVRSELGLGPERSPNSRR